MGESLDLIDLFVFTHIFCLLFYHSFALIRDDKWTCLSSLHKHTQKEKKNCDDKYNFSMQINGKRKNKWNIHW